jgi:tetratricopeptide (TPR) repeat protein
MAKPKALIFGIILLGLTLAACGGPEEKKMKFFDNGKRLYRQGEYVKARLEFKNTLQIDPKFADGYFMLGNVEQKTGNLKQAYGNFFKATELNPDHIDAQLQFGKLLLFFGATDKAKEKIRFILAKESGNRQALILQASLLLLEKDAAGAAALAEKLLTQGSQNPDVFIILAAAYTQNKDFQKAEEIYQQGVSVNPDNAMLHLALANFYKNSKQPDTAAAVMQKVIDLEPHEAAHKLSLAVIYWESGHQAQAVDLLEKLISADSTNAEKRLLAARFYIDKNQFEQAQKVLKDGIEKSPKSLKFRFLLSELYLNWQRPSEAINSLKEIVALSKHPVKPEIIDAKNALARIYLMLRQVERAELYINEVLQDNPMSVEGHFNQGIVYLLKSDGVNAVSEFRMVVSERPEFVTGFLRLASAHVLNRELGLAVDTLQNALKVNPENIEVLLALGRIYILQRDFNAAEMRIRKILDINPTHIKGREASADLLVMIKDFKGAELEYLKIKRDAPQYPIGYLKLSRLYDRQDKLKSALAVLEEGYRQNPASATLLPAIIQQYVRQKKHATAIGICEKRIRDNGKDVVAYDLLGWIYLDLGEFQKAEKTLMTAIDIEPMWPSPHNNLARIYLAQGRQKEAVEKYEIALKTNPQNAATYLSLGLLYEKGLEYKNAMRVYEKALRANPNFWFAANNLAFLLTEASDLESDFERAIRLAQNALKQRPGDAFILDTLGWAHYRLGNYNQASGLFEQALVKVPDSPILNYHMGMVLYKSVRLIEAKERLQKALDQKEDFYGRAEAEKTLNVLKAKS